MQGKGMLVTAQATLIPVTIVFFVIIGLAINEKLGIAGNEATMVIVFSIFFGIIVSAIETITTLKKINILEKESIEKQQDILKRQQEMILRAFGDEEINQDEGEKNRE